MLLTLLSTLQSGGGGGTAYSLTGESGSYIITGVTATFKRGYTLTGAAGNYAVTGVAAAMKRGYTLTAATGSYSVTGVSAALKRGYTLSADAGSYSTTGVSAALKRGYTLSASAGSYEITGTDAAMRKGRTLIAEAGTYTISGVDAAMRKGRTLIAEPGTYTILGANADLIVTRQTAGKLLVLRSPLPSGTALEHFLALQIGGGSGAVVLSHRIVSVSSSQRSDVLSEPRIQAQQSQAQALESVGTDDGVTARTAVSRLDALTGFDRLTVRTRNEVVSLYTHTSELVFRS